MRQHHQHQHDIRAKAAVDQGEDAEAMEELNDTELFICTPCALHDTHNGFRWSMQCEFSDRNLLRDCYIAIESLRKSFDLLQSFLPSWVESRLCFREPMGPVWVAGRQALWSSLSVEVETA
eukprot:11226834-Lingulodinium_polyedra.AAC.1